MRRTWELDGSVRRPGETMRGFERHMAIMCSVMGHLAGSAHYRNQGVDFASCHRCGCDMIRMDAGSEKGEWAEVPAGFRVVWRDQVEAGDAGSVASRMQRTVAPPRRRNPRSARPAPRRDPRTRPMAGAASMFGTLANLGKLIGNGIEDDTACHDMGGLNVICLPSAGVH
jgi:hypothetical protein